jgi:hypothetical protein
MATNIIAGTITAAIDLTSASYDNPVTNTGLITLSSAGIALQAGTSWTVLNTGAIVSPSGLSDYGVFLNEGGAVTNASGAFIGGGFGVGIFHAAGTVSNAGTIVGSTYEGVYLKSGGYITNANGGTISGSTHAALIKGGLGTVFNDGFITDQNNAAVVLIGGGYVDNQSQGTIRQASTGVYVNGGTGTVVNSGYLYASSGHAIELDHGGSVTNALGGTIKGAHPGIYSASITTHGSTATGAVTLVNDGFIGATYTTSSAVVLRATVNGGGTISNLSQGTISAPSHAIYVHGGVGSVYNAGLLTSNLHSVVDLASGGTIDNTGRILGSAPTSSAVYVTGGSGIVINQGTLAALSASGVALFSGGTVQDFGGATIYGGGTGDGVFIKGGAGTVQTRGTIIGHNGVAVSLPTGFANRVDYSAGAVFDGIVNGGNVIGSSIQSTLRLQYYSAHPVGTLTNLNGTFVNFQQISVKGAWEFGALDSLHANVTITDGSGGTNSPAGTIGGYGLNLGALDAVTLDAGAVVSRASAGITHTAAIYAGSTANNVMIANYGGLIENPTNTVAAGIALFDGGTVVNQTATIGTAAFVGTIVGHDVGIYAGGGTVSTVVNAGVVQAPGDTGVELKNGGLVDNLAGGLITAAQNGVVFDNGGMMVNAGVIVASNPTNAQGVYLNGPGSITNLAGGTISGVVGIQAGSSIAGMTVVDAGVIEGTSAAIEFQSAANNFLILDPGAYVRGLIDGKNGLGSGYTTQLELASGSGTGTLDTAITQFTNVNQVDVNPGASWVIDGPVATLTSGAFIDDQGALTLGSGLGGGGAILLGTNATLAFEPAAAPAPIIHVSGGQETIEILGALATGVTLSGSQLDISGAGVTLNVSTGLPSSDFGFVTNNGNTYIVACFATGTSILTAAGPRAVETLREGEAVITATGRLAAIRWIGHRRTELRRHPSPHDVMPVRVRAGAFGPGLPRRDLVLSPDHAVFVEGHLVPVRHLVNGVSIVQEARDSITYWHVELDRHDIVLAEGMACETFLDTGNRAAFENAEGPMELHPAFARAVWAEQGCAPILVDPAEPALRAIHTRLLAQARDLPIAPLANVSA